MGLTIHYTLKLLKDVRPSRAMSNLRHMQNICWEVFGYTGAWEDVSCDTSGRDITVPIPWMKSQNVDVATRPTTSVYIDGQPGAGCEPFTLGLCKYPGMLTVRWHPGDSDHVHDRDGRFNFRKWKKWLQKNKLPYHACCDVPLDWCRERKVRTGYGAGWHWWDFCKTEYACSPEHGGIENFIRCHAGIIEVLQRIGDLPYMVVSVYDESGYGSIDGEHYAIDLEPGHFDKARLRAYMGHGAVDVVTPATKVRARRGVAHLAVSNLE